MKLEDFLKQKDEFKETEILYPIEKIRIHEDHVTLVLPEERITVSVEAYFRYGLKDRKGLDGSLYETLKKDERITKAYRSCLRKLSVRDRTVKQISDHLRTLDLEKEEKEEILSRLETYGLLDDERYCQGRIETYERNDLSAKQISQKLQRDGIGEDLIEKYVKVNSEGEAQKASAVAARYAETLRNKPLPGRKRAVLSKLLSAGFSYDISKTAVESLEMDAEGDLGLLEKEYGKALRKYEKKYSGFELKQRIVSALYSKGFQMEDIRKVTED